MMRNLFLTFGLIFSLIAHSAIPTRLGDTEVLGYLKPGSTGIDLGSSVAQWDAYLQNLHLYNQSAGALYLDSGSSVASLASVSETELGYLDGVTSSIQTQLDSKLGEGLSTGHLYIGDGSSVAQARQIAGDVVVDQNGDAQVQSGVINNAEVGASAAIVDTKLDTISTPGKVANAATTATAANTANTIMMRDAVGQVAASTFTGNVVGDVTGTASGNVPNARTILTTAPMYGGGDLSANRTFAMYQASGSSDGYLGSADYTTLMAKVAATRAINTTSPLQGGGDLSSDRTLTIDDASSTGKGAVTISDQEFAGQKDFQKIGLKQTTDSSTGNIDALTTTSFSSFRLTGAAPVLRGIAGGASGRIIVIVNASGTTISVKNEDAAPSAANKIITGTAADLTLADTASVVLQYDGASSRWRVVGGSGGGSSAAGNAVITSATQTTHGFAVGDLIYNTGSAYAKAKADTEATAEVLGIVTTVPTANTFTFTTAGELTGILSGLTPGAAYYLSGSTAGAYTATEPTTVGYVSKPVFIAAGSSTAAFVIHSRGQVVTAAAGGGARAQISYSDQTAGIGSTNTKVMKWATARDTTWVGDLTYVETAANGGYVGIGSDGLYDIAITWGDGNATTQFGFLIDFTGSTFTMGGAELTGNIRTQGWADGRRCVQLAGIASGYATCSYATRLGAGAKIWFVTNSGAVGSANSSFTVMKVSN